MSEEILLERGNGISDMLQSTAAHTKGEINRGKS